MSVPHKRETLDLSDDYFAAYMVPQSEAKELSTVMNLRWTHEWFTIVD